MREFFLILNILLSIGIVALILTQGRGGGLGSAWGGAGEQFQTRRGVEKLTMRFTMILIILFLITSLVNFFVL